MQALESEILPDIASRQQVEMASVRSFGARGCIFERRPHWPYPVSDGYLFGADMGFCELDKTLGDHVCDTLWFDWDDLWSLHLGCALVYVHSCWASWDDGHHHQ